MESLKELLQEAQHQISRLQVLEKDYSELDKSKGPVYFKRKLHIQNKLNSISSKIEKIYKSQIIHYLITFTDNTNSILYIDSSISTEDIIFFVEYKTKKQVKTVQNLQFITTGVLLNPRKRVDILK